MEYVSEGVLSFMKKIFILALLVLTAFISATQKSYAVIDPYSNTENGLGYSINLITADSIAIRNVKTSAPVLSTSFLNAASIVTTSPRTSVTYVTEGSSFSDYHSSLKSKYQSNASIYGTDGTLSAAAELGFSTYSGVTFSQYGSQYFYTLSFRDSRYAMQILNHKTNRNQFKNNLDSLYIQSLNDVINQQKTWDWFFDTYGTHLIVSAEFGAKADASYVAYSNRIAFGAEMQAEISSKIGAGILGVFGGSSSSTVNLNSISYITTGDILSKFYISTTGGNSFSTTNYDAFRLGYQNWINSISDQSSSLVDVADDGLIPLWEILPSNMQILSEVMRYQYEIRCLNKYNQVSSKLSNGLLYATEFLPIRSSLVTISDSGRFNQHSDSIDLSLQGINFDSLKASGYKYVYIDLYFQVREQEDGYQYFFIFKNSIKSNDYLIHTEPFEYYPGVRHRSFEERSFSLPALSISDFSGSSFVIRYGASGVGNDDWINYGLYVRVSVTK